MTAMSLLHDAVLLRDRQCVLALVDRGHSCRDQWGNVHPADDIAKLTLEHVREHPGGMRRDDEGWCVAMCHEANIEHAGSTTFTRGLLNAYLAGVRAATR